MSRGMTTASMSSNGPELPAGRGVPSSRPRPAGGAHRDERLKTLYARWNQFATEYEAARTQNDQELMTNLRGLMILIKREIHRLGGELPKFPYPDEPLLADL